MSQLQCGFEQKEPRGARGKGGKDLWKNGSAYLTTKLIPVIPVVPASSEFNSRLGLSYTSANRRG
jgi:hypothetical protein